MLQITTHWNIKHGAIIIFDKLYEQKFNEHLVLGDIRKLVLKLPVGIVLEDKIPSLVPLVLKIDLNTPLHIDINFLVIVIVEQDSKKSIEFIISAVVSIKLLPLLDYLNELSHDVREDGHSKKQAEGDEQSLDIRPRVEVAKAHSRQ